MADTRQNAKDLFCLAVEKTGYERASFLDQACAGDAALRARLDALLQAHEAADNLLDQPAIFQSGPFGPAESERGAASWAEQFSVEDLLARLEPSSRSDSLGRMDHYDVLQVLSQGGMGALLQAFDTKLHRTVAIKVLAPRLATNQTARQRVLSEARAAAAVVHEHVIGIHAVQDSGPMPYVVMPFVEGQSLQEKIDANGALPLDDVLRTGMQIAEGIAVAHRLGLVHRDIKPANILLEDPLARVKIADFGLAGAVGDGSLTPNGFLAGTPDYMSPEQASGGVVDERSDLFSLGSVLYAMCTGQKPFVAKSTLGVLEQVKTATTRSPGELNPAVPGWLEAIICRLHARNPAERGSAEEVAEQLASRLASRQPPDADLPLAMSATPPRPSTSRRKWILAGTLLSLGLAAIAILPAIPHNPLDLAAADAVRPVRFGILYSQTGTMGSSEPVSIDAALLAIDEINAKGGLLGRTVEPVIVDAMSDPRIYADKAEQLIVDDQVSAILGCWTSASRKAVAPVVEKHDHLLIYSMPYEGLEQSPNIVYTGSLPNQQVATAVEWSIEHLGRRFFIVGSDYIWPRATSEVVRDVVGEFRGEIVGEQYLALGSTQVEELVQRIKDAQPEVILEMVAGDSKVAYYRALRRAGITPDRVPSISLSSRQPGLTPRDMAGDYAAWSYFEKIDSAANRDFVARFQAKYGPQRLVSDPMEASYMSVHLWARAVREAGRADPAAIRQALVGGRFQAPEGEVRICRATQHAWKTARIARFTDDGTAEIVWTSASSIPPRPFPASRSRADWEAMLSGYFHRWGGRWSAPAPESSRPRNRL